MLLAFRSPLGGMNTLIGTPPNIPISDALRPFQMFDFAPVGVVILLVGVAFRALVVTLLALPLFWPLFL